MSFKLFGIVFVLMFKHALLDFTAFGRKDIYDSSECLDDTSTSFRRSHTSLATCMAQCAETSQCVGIFFIVDTFKCMGCSSYNFLTSSVTSQYYEKALPIGYVGCYADHSPRVLNGHHFSSGAMTNELCQQTCFDEGFMYAATQYRSHCFCGNSYNILEEPNESLCNMACSGDSSQICGAGWRNSIYRVRSI